VTFSLVACDLEAQDWGVVVASRFLAAGAVVPWVSSDAGAVATQSYANVAFGPDGLELMRSGVSAQDALDRLVAGDPGRDQRQVGVVDRGGGAEPALPHSWTVPPGSTSTISTSGCAYSRSASGVPVSLPKVPQWQGTQRFAPSSSSATAASRGPIV